mgnify:CR=1 FL=1
MKKRLIICLIGFLSAILFLVLYKYIHGKTGIGIPCPFHELTGLYCPGCGSTRCIFALLEGNIYQAFRYNPLVFILLPFVTFYFLYNAYLYVYEKKDAIFRKIPSLVYIILIIITIGFGIIRNIPYFTFLRP